MYVQSALESGEGGLNRALDFFYSG